MISMLTSNGIIMIDSEPRIGAHGAKMLLSIQKVQEEFLLNWPKRVIE